MYAMKKSTSLLLLSFFLFQCLTNASSISNGTKAELAATIKSGRGPWCLPRQTTTAEMLQANIQFSCGGGIADCKAIQKGGRCYFPNNVFEHASYAMTAYYYATGHQDINCYFSGTGVIVWEDPSYGNCQYPS